MTRQDCEKLADDLFFELGLNRPDSPDHWRGWKFGFDAGKTRFGCCRFRSRTITLSWRLVQVNDAREVGQTIRHEIAHARAGYLAGHGPDWKREALLCGDDGRRCWDIDNVVQVDAEWEATCVGCGRVAKRHAPPKKGRSNSCHKCDAKFNPRFILIWRSRAERKALTGGDIMTSSFVKILARHTGPYRLQVALAPDGKNRRGGVWMPERTDEPVDGALALLEKMGAAATSVLVWSESEQQFVMTVEPKDRPTWTAEREGWREAARVIRHEAIEEIAAVRPAPKTPSDVSPEMIAKVMALRAKRDFKGRNMGYVAIELALLGESRKGFWSWRIVKAEEARLKGVRP